MLPGSCLHYHVPLQEGLQYLVLWQKKCRHDNNSKIYFLLIYVQSAIIGVFSLPPPPPLAVVFLVCKLAPLVHFMWAVVRHLQMEFRHAGNTLIVYNIRVHPFDP